MLADIKLALQSLEEGNVEEAKAILSECAENAEIDEAIEPDTEAAMGLSYWGQTFNSDDAESRRHTALAFAKDIGGFNKIHDFISNAGLIEAFLKGDSRANA